MERRKHKRIDYWSPVYFSSHGKSYHGYVYDVSPVGILIRTQAWLRPDTKLTMNYPTGETTSISKGVVIWSDENRMGIKVDT